MKMPTKLIYGFFLISLFVAAIGMLSLYQINKIALPLNKDVPESIDEFTQAEYLDGLAQFIRYYDEVLTQSARNYAFTQNQKWEQRYRDSEPQLDSIIKDAISKCDEVDKEFFSKVDEANLALVKMEYESIDYVNQRKPDEAIRILESDEYWNQKRIYEQGLRDYVAKRGNKYEEAAPQGVAAHGGPLTRGPGPLRARARPPGAGNGHLHRAARWRGPAVTAHAGARARAEVQLVRAAPRVQRPAAQSAQRHGHCRRHGHAHRGTVARPGD